MATELDRIAKKNTEQKIKGAYKNLGIKRHNLKAALKANKADPEEQGWFGSKRSKSIRKKLNKVNKTDKWIEKQHDKLIDHGVWSKKNTKGSGLDTLEKKEIIKPDNPYSMFPGTIEAEELEKQRRKDSDKRIENVDLTRIGDI